MPADFPNAIKTFTPLVPGVDQVRAVDHNVAYDEITAIQTKLLDMGPGATVFVCASNAKASSIAACDRTYLCDGTADEVQINLAIAALPLVDGKRCGTVRGSEGTFNLSATGLTITGNLDEFHFDFRTAKITYPGTGTAITLGLLRSFVDIGKLEAVDDAVNSATALGIYWMGSFAKGNVYIKNFKAGTAMRVASTNSAFFEHVKVDDCKVAILAMGPGDAEGDACANLWGMLDYRVSADSGISGATCIKATNNGRIAEDHFDYICWTYYPATGDFTVFDIDNLTYVVSANVVSGEAQYTTGNCILLAANRTSGTVDGALILGLVNCGAPSGLVVIKGDAIQIRPFGVLGPNIYPGWNPQGADEFTLYGTGLSAAIDTGDGRHGTVVNSVRIDWTQASDAYLVCRYKKLRPAPGSTPSFQLAVKSNTPNIYVRPWLDTYDQAGNQLQAIGCPWFHIVAADTWYFFTSYGGAFYHVSDLVYEGHLQVDVASINTVNGTTVNISEFGLYCEETRAASSQLADPGNWNAIPVYDSGTVALVTAGAETRTLAAPTFVGQELTLYCKTYVGNCVVTCATTINETGNNTMTFSATGQAVHLRAVEEGATLRWRFAQADGAVLSTV